MRSRIIGIRGWNGDRKRICLYTLKEFGRLQICTKGGISNAIHSNILHCLPCCTPNRFHHICKEDMGLTLLPITSILRPGFQYLRSTTCIVLHSLFIRSQIIIISLSIALMATSLFRSHLHQASLTKAAQRVCCKTLQTHSTRTLRAFLMVSWLVQVPWWWELLSKIQLAMGQAQTMSFPRASINQ